MIAAAMKCTPEGFVMIDDAFFREQMAVLSLRFHFNRTASLLLHTTVVVLETASDQDSRMLSAASAFVKGTLTLILKREQQLSCLYVCFIASSFSSRSESNTKSMCAFDAKNAAEVTEHCLRRLCCHSQAI